MPHRCIARLASVVVDVAGEGVTDQTRWDEFISQVKQLLPRNALSEQDYLVRMTRKAKEPWLDFLDRYWLYAETCQEVSEAVKTAELFRKFPRELRLQLSHVKHDASLGDLCEAVRGVRFWSHSTQDKTIPFDPMEVDNHMRSRHSEDWDAVVDAPEEVHEFRQGMVAGFDKATVASSARCCVETPSTSRTSTAPAAS